METFSFATSSALDKLPVNVRIDRLDGHHKSIPYSVLLKRPDLRHRASNTNSNSELYVETQLWADSKPLAVSVCTSYKSFKSARIWNEWLAQPVVYSNLPQTAQLAITIWDLSPGEGSESNGHAIPFGGTTIPLFDKDNTLHQGRQRCRVHRHRPADGLSSTITPWILPSTRKGRKDQATPDTANEQAAEMERLEGLLKKQEMGEIAQNTWLDQMVFRKMTKIRSEVTKAELATRQRHNHYSSNDNTQSRPSRDEEEDLFYLDIELPRFDHPIVFADVEYPPPPISSMRLPDDIRLRPPPEVSFGPGINNGYGSDSVGRMVRIYDPEVGMKDNPAETKHRRLVRSNRTGAMDREAKPSPNDRDTINKIMSYGPLHELNPQEKDLIWTYRYYLLRDKRALTKYVKSVVWSDPAEFRRAEPLLAKWSEIDVDAALELLGPGIDNATVRAYAVDRLRKADDEELLLYLLQMVQALKYENVSPETAEANVVEDSPLAKFLVTRAANSFKLSNDLFWYLCVEIDDHTKSKNLFLLELFREVLLAFQKELELSAEGMARRKMLKLQAELFVVLTKLSTDIRLSREDRPRKIERLKKFLADGKNELASFEPFPLPWNTTLIATGIDANDATVLKSNMFPLLLRFKIQGGADYPVIFKTGDDLRQDQLVIQIISLMDRLLQRENVDLKLTPYRILATSTLAGGPQFIPSMSLAAAVSKYKGSLLAYLRANNPDDGADLGVRKEAMDTYIKSCAGYCVITYLLGVGDRHLDNLLISPAGNFFHVDFGYILGHDPKPFSPQMKLCREMIEGMGGPQHPNYTLFKSFCYTAYTTLRKSSSLLLNLFALMREANIPDIAFEREGSVKKVQERLWLDLSEEEAIRGFEELIEQSKSAMMPVVIDKLHTYMQNWRT